MDKKKIIIASVCLLIAIALAIGQYFYLSSQFKIVEVPVLVAKDNIASGTELKEGEGGNVEKILIPQKAHINTMVSSLGNQKVYTKVDIPKGSYITNNVLSTKKIPLPKGDQRKVTIKVNLHSFLAGKVVPGDVIDIGYIPNKEANEPKTVIAEKIIVLDITNEKGVNTKGSEQSKNAYAEENIIPSAVTVLVENTEQGLMLKEKEQKGSLFAMGY